MPGQCRAPRESGKLVLEVSAREHCRRLERVRRRGTLGRDGKNARRATRAEALENIREAITEYLAAKSAEIQGDSDVRSVQHEEVFV